MDTALASPELAHEVYTSQDDCTWRKVRDELFPLQDRFAFEGYLESRTALLHDCRSSVPRPWDVSRRLIDRSGFSVKPADSIVKLGDFFECLRQCRFTAVTKVRRAAEWRFCPSPDWIHESTGHVTALGDSRVATVYRMFGDVAAQSPSKETLQRLGRLYWFIFEVGLVRERGRVKAFGAAILSSLAEIENIERAELRSFSPAEIERTSYTYRETQPTYFVADSVDQMLDDTVVRLKSIAAIHKE